jgi:kinesin family protein 6/9
MMTSVLRDSLGGNCKTIMIATINPEAAHSDESLSTCRFAQRVSLIKNKASINEDLDPLQLIRRLKAELLNLREEISFLKGENSDEEQILTPSETEELMNNVRIYMNDPDIRAILNIGMHSLTHLLTLTHSYSLTHSLTLIHSLLLTQES